MKRFAVPALLAFGLALPSAYGRMNFSEYVKRNHNTLKKTAKPIEIIAFKEKEPLRLAPEDAARGVASADPNAPVAPGGATPVKAAFPVQGAGVPASGAVGGGLTNPPPAAVSTPTPEENDPGMNR